VYSTQPHLAYQTPGFVEIKSGAPDSVQGRRGFSAPADPERTSGAATDERAELAEVQLTLNAELGKHHGGALVELAVVAEDRDSRLDHEAAHRPPGEEDAAGGPGTGAGQVVRRWSRCDAEREPALG